MRYQCHPNGSHNAVSEESRAIHFAIHVTSIQTERRTAVGVSHTISIYHYSRIALLTIDFLEEPWNNNHNASFWPWRLSVDHRDHHVPRVLNGPLLLLFSSSTRSREGPLSKVERHGTSCGISGSPAGRRQQPSGYPLITRLSFSSRPAAPQPNTGGSHRHTQKGVRTE